MFEVTLEASGESKGEWLLAQVGIYEQKQESRVEELDEECDLGDLFKLLCLGRVTNPCHKLDAHCSKHKVYASYEVLEGVEPEEDL